MGRVRLAFRIFWKTLRREEVAGRVDRLLREDPLLASVEVAPQPAPEPIPPAAVKKKEVVAKPAGRNDALNFLAALQREARFVDFIQEPIAEYTDAQIGAAVRDIHRDCGQLVSRVFRLKPAVEGSEGSPIELPVGFDAGRYRLTGAVSGQPPFKGRLAHHGWEAAQCELPAWTGSSAAAMIVAPAEVELS